VGLLVDTADYLTWNEQVVLSVRRHEWVLVRPTAETVTVFLVALLLSPTSGSSALSNLLALIAVGFLLRLGWRALQWWNERIVVTDRRIFEVSGVAVRRVDSMPLRKVTDFAYRRSLLGRIMGFGEFVVESAGQDQRLGRITYLPNPDGFYRTVTWLVFGETPSHS
jgi:uncharacterized membrane protein YdbT with pleckstrin-like domain